MSLGIGINLGVSSRLGGAGYSYLVTTDAELTTVLALGAATLAGKTVAMDGTFTTPNFNIAPSSTTTFRSLNPSSPAVLVRAKLNSTSNLLFQDLKIVTDCWTDNGSANNEFAALLYNSGTFGANTFRTCTFRGGYGGPGSTGLVYDNDFDPLAVYPEYACIIPTFTAGAITAVSATTPNNYVGGLMADGTGYTWTVNTNTSTNGGVTWTVNAAGTFDVVSGLITNLAITNGGASNAGTNPGMATAVKTITWTAQRPFMNVSAGGVAAAGGLTFTGRQWFDQCTFTDLRDGVKFGVGAPGYIDVTGCTFDRIYHDTVSVFLPASSTGAGYTFTDNFMTRYMARVGDPYDPHADAFQFFTTSVLAGNWADITIERNVVLLGNTRGQNQGIFQSITDSKNYTNLRIVGNLVLSRYESNQLSLGNTDGAYVYRNTFVRFLPDDTENNSTVATARFNTGFTGIGNTYIAKNFAETFTLSGVNVASGNVTLTPSSTSDYDAKFLSPPTFAGGSGSWPTTKAAALAAFSPEAAFAGTGAAGSDGYLDYTNKTTDVTMEPVFTAFVDLTGQTPSSAVSSGWVQIMGGPSTGTISISGATATYQFADDAAGTNATVATASSGSYARGKFVRINLTNSSSDLTQTTGTITLQGTGSASSYNYSFNSTTASTFVRPVVALDSATPDIFRVTGASTMGSDGFLGTIALWGVKINGNPTATTQIYSASAGSGAVLINVNTSGQLLVGLRNAAGTTIAQILTLNTFCNNVAHDVLVSYDTNDTTVGTGLHLYVDGTRVTTGSSWVGASTQVGYSRSISSYQLGPTVNTQKDYEIAGLYINCTQRVDFTNSANRTAFTLTPTAMGLDGSTPTGTQPGYFFVGTAGQSGGWNDAAGINRGSRSKFIKVGSASATDVSGNTWA